MRTHPSYFFIVTGKGGSLVSCVIGWTVFRDINNFYPKLESIAAKIFDSLEAKLYKMDWVYVTAGGNDLT